jgi:hypothetical protein
MSLRSSLVSLAAAAALLSSEPSGVLTAQQNIPATVFETVASARNSPQVRSVRPLLAALQQAGQAGATVALPLPGMDVVGRFTHYEAQGGGFFAAGPLSHVTAQTAANVSIDGEVSLTVVDGTLAGRVVAGDRLFTIRRLGASDLYDIEEVDTLALPLEDHPIAMPQDGPAAAVGEPSEAGDTNAFVDLLIAYTPAARNTLGGTSQIQAEATAAVNNANLALSNSGAVHRYRLVYLGEVSYTESGNSSTDLSRLRSVTDGFMDGIHGLRDLYKADVVSLLTQASDVCGVGYLLGPSPSTSFNTSAFNITIALNCANANLSLPHEIGHNSGLHHDRPNAGSTPAYDFAYGYTVPGLARTVMAYACASGGGCPRRAVFSSPNVFFPATSTPAGTATEDNTRAHNLTSPVVANFRNSACNFTLNTNAISVGLGGGSGTVGVTSSTGCAWNAVSSDTAVVTITGGSSSSGSANAAYSVSSSAGPRSAALTIAGQTVTVTQAAAAPGAFGKSSPANGATGQSTSPTLSWSASSGAASYEYCIDTSNNNSCNTSWVSAGSNTSVALSGLANLQPHYWQVRAVNAGGTTYAQASAASFWSFTTRPRPRAVVDLNGDGAGDVFTYAAATGQWSRQVSNGAGGFAATNGNWDPGWSVMPAKFNGDALTDFFLFNTSTGAWSKMLNDGAGFTIQSSGSWWNGWQRFVINLDADGVSDLFLYDPVTGQWFKCISTPTGFTYTQGGWNPAWEIHPMELNSDAFGDMFLINRTTGRWFWVLGSAGSGFTYPVSETWFAGWGLYPGDFNADGLTDLLLHDPPTGTYFVATTGASGFTYQQGGWSLGWTPWVGDLNNDAAEDLFLHDPLTGKWFEMISNGAGSFANAGGQTWSLGWSIQPTDLNADGRTDFVLYHPVTGAWYQARNFTAGTFTYTNGGWSAALTIVVRPPFF